MIIVIVIGVDVIGVDLIDVFIIHIVVMDDVAIIVAVEDCP